MAKKIQKSKAKKTKKKTPVAKKPVKVTKKKKTTKRKKGKVMRLAISAVRVRQLAFACETMAIADEKAGLSSPLSNLIAKHKTLTDAWERGRFLYGLKALAAKAISIAEAGQVLEIENLKQVMEKEPELRDVWNQARLETTVKLKEAWLAAALKGQTTALINVERALRNEIAKTSRDFNTLSIDELVKITGKTRQTIHDWHTKHGLSRNSDRTFNLKVFLIWFEEFIAGKIAAGKVVPATNAFQTAKAKQINMAMAKERGDTLNRSEVVTGLIARHQVFMNEFVNKIPTMSLSCVGQPQNKIDKILTERATRILEQLCTVPTQLRLDSDLEEKLIEILSAIKPEGSESENTNNKPAQ